MARALQLDSRQAFESASDARVELDPALRAQLSYDTEAEYDQKGEAKEASDTTAQEAGSL